MKPILALAILFALAPTAHAQLIDCSSGQCKVFDSAAPFMSRGPVRRVAKGAAIATARMGVAATRVAARVAVAPVRLAARGVKRVAQGVRQRVERRQERRFERRAARRARRHGCW